MTRRYVIIIGAMKSGTTTLFDVLARHPAIVPSVGKEPRFFAFDHVFEQGLDWFDTRFDFDPATHIYRLEASTDYTKAPLVDRVWERMTAHPDVEVKLIYLMRHPLRRIESHARHVQRSRKEIGSEISPRPDHSLDAGLSLVNLAASRYAAQLDRFRPAWEAGNLHCVTLEGLRKDPEGALRAVFGFLGLDPAGADAPLPAQNTAAGRTRQHPAMARLSRLGPLMAVARQVLPQSLRDRLKGQLRQKVELEGRFVLTEAEEALLTELLADDLARLRDVYGLDTHGLWGL